MFGSHLCIPGNETVQPRYFQNRVIIFCLLILTLIYDCERFIYIQDRSVYFAAAKYVDRFWEYIDHSHDYHHYNGLSSVFEQLNSILC
jgi:hypothetical protein